MMKIRVLLLAYLFVSQSLYLSADARPYPQAQKVYVYGKDNSYGDTVEGAFKQFDIEFEAIDEIPLNDDTNLYVILDVASVDSANLPKYYIAYQSIDLQNNELTDDYLSKLSGAVAVWDYSYNNIQAYRSNIYNYYYFPKDYEYTDPVILPCFLPISALDGYKEILIYSNHENTEISSLVPALFFHSYIKQPKLIVEAGVCLGYSTHAFAKINELWGSHVIGLDNDPNSAPSYHGVPNSVFVLINDLEFDKYYSKSIFKDWLVDIAFVDTSHEYNHSMAEIKVFSRYLTDDGLMMFHDSNVTPLVVGGRPAFWRLNDTIQQAAYNPRGVTYALKESFSVTFDESKYINTTFEKDGQNWHMVHYPFCNGLTVLRKI